MHRFPIIFAIIILCSLLAGIFCHHDDDDGDADDAEATEEVVLLPGLPENTEIVHIDSMDYIKQDNKKHQMMGVSDDKCDNASYSLEVDFDPFNQTLLELNSKCAEDNFFHVDASIGPRLTLLTVPQKYMPIHRCMFNQIKYTPRIPLIGPHRPLWAGYGEYEYLPPQRWLHNVEHGAIIVLYHPCADPDEVNPLKELVKRCLFRHVITPFANLTRERPIALVGWAASLEFARFDADLSKEFIKFYARTGPERMFRNGQYRSLLVDPAKVISNVIDSHICPNE